ncbi:TIGR00730 family Rossman fold protein [soil metagenome]
MDLGRNGKSVIIQIFLKMKNIAFFLSARDIDKKYSEPALELVRQCIQHGYGFVYGGSETGLMKSAAHEAHKLNGKIIAISCEEFKDVVTEECDEKVIAADIPERIKILIEKSDAIIALPGGAGTLNEIAQAIEGKKLDLHNKPIIFLNIDGFWVGLIEQYRRMQYDGFLHKKIDHLFYESDNIESIITYLKTSLGV